MHENRENKQAGKRFEPNKTEVTDTSKESLSHELESGNSSTQIDRVLTVLYSLRPMWSSTRREVVDDICGTFTVDPGNCHTSSYTRTFKVLLDRGILRLSIERKCSISGRKAQTLKVAEGFRQALSPYRDCRGIIRGFDYQRFPLLPSECISREQLKTIKSFGEHVLNSAHPLTKDSLHDHIEDWKDEQCEEQNEEVSNV